jgi:hypothetical protein
MLRRLIPIFSIFCMLNPLPVFAIQSQSFVIWRQPLSRSIGNFYQYQPEKTIPTVNNSHTSQQQAPVSKNQIYSPNYESSSPWSNDTYSVEYRSYWESTRDNGNVSY